MSDCRSDQSEGKHMLHVHINNTESTGPLRRETNLEGDDGTMLPVDHWEMPYKSSFHFLRSSEPLLGKQ